MNNTIIVIYNIVFIKNVDRDWNIFIWTYAYYL